MREAISGLDLRSSGLQPAIPTAPRNEEEQTRAPEERQNQGGVSEIVNLSPEAVALSQAVQPTSESAPAEENTGDNGRLPPDELPRFLDIRV